MDGRTAILASIMAAYLLSGCQDSQDAKLKDLEERVAKLEEATRPLLEKEEAQRRLEAQRAKARERMREDSKIYAPDELKEIESLYQVANRDWKSQESKESLKALVAKYKDANRTGCSLLYLGQMNGDSDEAIAYLKEAIDKYGSCFYGDGVQVGAYARYYLLWIYHRKGEKEKSRQLVEEIKSQYPDAVDHSGKSLVKILDESATELGK